jgi:hypothetical protein
VYLVAERRCLGFCAPDIARILRRAMKDGHQALKEARGRSDGADSETLSL